jgi:hypothetical protein
VSSVISMTMFGRFPGVCAAAAAMSCAWAVRVAAVVEKGWCNLRGNQRLATGVGAPVAIAPWKRIAQQRAASVFAGEAWFDPIEVELREPR